MHRLLAPAKGTNTAGLHAAGWGCMMLASLHGTLPLNGSFQAACDKTRLNRVRQQWAAIMCNSAVHSSRASHACLHVSIVLPFRASPS